MKKIFLLLLAATTFPLFAQESSIEETALSYAYFSKPEEYRNCGNIFDAARDQYKSKASDGLKARFVFIKNTNKYKNTPLYDSCEAYAKNVWHNHTTSNTSFLTQLKDFQETMYLTYKDYNGEANGCKIVHKNALEILLELKEGTRQKNAAEVRAVNINISANFPLHRVLQKSLQASPRKYTKLYGSLFNWISNKSAIIGGSLLCLSPLFSIERNAQLQYWGFFFTGTCLLTGSLSQHFDRKTTKYLHSEEALKNTMQQMSDIEKEAREKILLAQQ